MYSFILVLLATTTLFLTLTGFLPNSLKRSQYLCIWFIILCCYPFAEFMGKSSTYIVLCIAIFLIVIFSRFKIPNLMVTLLGYLFSVMCNNLLLNILPLFFHTSLSELSLFGLIALQCCFMVLLIGCVIVFRRYALPRLSFILKKEYQFSCICIIFEELICTGIYIFLIVQGERFQYPADLIASYSFLFLLLFVSILIVLLSVSNSHHKEQKTRQRLEQLESLESYTEDLEKLHKIMRSMNHDYKNLFSTAYSFIELGDLEGLKNFYTKSLHMISADFDSSTNELANLANVHLPEIKGLLYSKAIQALTQNLILKIRIDYEIRSVTMDTTDLVRILGIYLDNALEAATKSNEKIIFLHFSKSGSSTIWSISNSTNPITVSIDRLCEYGFSTKGKDHGIGLYTVCELLQKYPHIIANTRVRNCQFIQTLENI